MATAMKNVAVNLSTTGVIVTPPSGFRVVVHALVLIPTGTAVNVYALTGTTAKLGDGTRPIPLDKAGAAGSRHIVLPQSADGWFEGAVDEALSLNLSTGQGVTGIVLYSLRAG